MEEIQTAPSPLLYKVLRVLAGFMTLIAALLISYACVAALLGDPEMLIDFIDDDAASLEMGVPTILAIVATNALAITSLTMLFVSLNRFLRYAQSGELLIAPARAALKRLGIAMILLYLTSRFLAVLIPIAGISGFWMENGFYIVLTFIDLDFLYLLVGVVLLALGQALREGQVAKEEAKQYV